MKHAPVFAVQCEHGQTHLAEIIIARSAILAVVGAVLCEGDVTLRASNTFEQRVGNVITCHRLIALFEGCLNLAFVVSYNFVSTEVSVRRVLQVPFFRRLYPQYLIPDLQSDAAAKGTRAANIARETVSLTILNN